MIHDLQESRGVITLQLAKGFHSLAVRSLDTVEKRHVCQFNRYCIGLRLQGFVLGTGKQI